MSPSERSRVVKQLAAEIGFDRCGIAAAGRIPHADFFIEWLAQGFAGSMAYLHRHQASRVDLRAWLPQARSVIVVAHNYNQTEPRRPETGDLPSGQARGRVAMYARGEDYHVVVQEKLAALVARMRGAFGESFEARACVDTSAIVERELAAAAGVGWIGKNTMVLHQSLGSFFFLGEIITDLELPPDAPVPDRCGTCTRCLEACPTQAFPRPYVMDARRCISYLTIEHHGEIDPALAEKMGDWVFGCDVCQTVCPFNNKAPATKAPRYWGTFEDARPALDEILDWDEAAYRRHVAGKATKRAKPEMWRRNAKIAQQNRP